jgi:hypothetical protein
VRAEDVRRALLRAAAVALVVLATGPLFDRIACRIAPLFADSDTMYYWFAHPWHAAVAAGSVFVASLLERRVALAIPAALLAAFFVEVQCFYVCMVVESGSTIGGLKEFTARAMDNGRWLAVRALFAALGGAPVAVVALRRSFGGSAARSVVATVLSAAFAVAISRMDSPSNEHAIFWALTDAATCATLLLVWRRTEPSAIASEPTSSSA